jgi:hypothetical protein
MNGLATSIDLTKIPREQMPLIAMKTPCEDEWPSHYSAIGIYRESDIISRAQLPFSFAQPSTRTSYYFAHCQPILGKLHEEFEINRSH